MRASVKCFPFSVCCFSSTQYTRNTHTHTLNIQTHIDRLIVWYTLDSMPPNANYEKLMEYASNLRQQAQTHLHPRRTNRRTFTSTKHHSKASTKQRYTKKTTHTKASKCAVTRVSLLSPCTIDRNVRFRSKMGRQKMQIVFLFGICVRPEYFQLSIN